MKKGAAAIYRGFTLLEVCMAVAIGMLMVGLAMPSVTGLFAEQRLRSRMIEFEDVVRNAASQSKLGQQEFRMRWYKEGIAVESADTLMALKEKDIPPLVFTFQKDEVFQLKRVAARLEKPMTEWSFWPNGIREPVEVGYTGPLGVFALRFGALAPDPDEITVRPR
ncbi:MAG: hypothetical protein WCO60_08615 [Verrucomicrobiota bacterium]